MTVLLKLIRINRIISRLITILLLNVVSYSASAQTDRQIIDSIDQIIRTQNSNGPGLSIAVVRNSQIYYSNSVGLANIKRGITVDSNTTFWIASVSKQFTAAAIFRFINDKRISLANSIRRYLPELPVIYDRITISHLIYHTSGIRDGFVLTALAKNPPSEYTNENVVRYLKSSTAFNFEPGSRFEYNNSGYVLLAEIIERVSGKTFPAYMAESIFQPLKMDHTFVSPAFPTGHRQAEGYRQNADGTYQEYHFTGNTFGSTGIVTTLSDLARWAQFIQKPSSVSALAWLPPQLLKTGTLDNGTSIAYAGGLERFHYKGRTVYEHFGSDEGFKADIIYFPETRTSIIGMTNNSSNYGLMGLLFRISDIVQANKQEVEETSAGGPLTAESFYYNSHEPQVLKVLRHQHITKISTTPSGYAAPYKLFRDTMQSNDPLPALFLSRDNYIQVIDPYYHKQTRLEKIYPKTSKADLQIFTGEYFSKELQSSYRIISDENGLKFEFIPGLSLSLFRLTDTDFVFEYEGPNFLQFTKDGLLLSREGVRRLELNKKSGK